ncbi:hypothetical protein [Actinocorallia longicatena]|uniref:Lipase (Class 3) n=1 Tax=Actinocorallia longicatena TaxID=111803 RepID=A0ABP6QDD0_9ACTN
MTEQRDDPAALLAAARELAEIAHVLRTASAHATAALTDPALTASLRRTPGPGLRAHRALLGALTDRAGLGWALTGGALGAVGAKLGGLVNAGSLPIAVMTTSLRLRIAAVTLRNPELAADPLLSALQDAVAADSALGSARALRELVRDRGMARTLSAMAPIFGEILALRALLDQNPLNDHTAWLIASGMGTATADPLTGLSNRAIARLDSGRGAAVRTEPEPGEEAGLSTRASLLGFLGDLLVIRPTGRAVLETVLGPDGVERHVLLAPGMRMGDPQTDSPGDLLGAFSSTVLDGGPYSRSLAKAVADYGLPEGAELALVGHSAGGAAVMSLAQDAAFAARHRLTHVIAIGSPVDFKKPASPETWVASVTNQHDIIPSLDGQGAGNCFDLHPGWYVVDYTDPTHVFPACHSLEQYTANLTHDLPEARAHIEERLASYAGPVVRRQVYALRDHAAAPAGFPFLTVPTYAHATPGGNVDLPAGTPDATTFTAWFAADPAAAEDLLAAEGRGEAVRAGHRVLAVLRAVDHRGGTLGDHQEVTLALLVHDPWRNRPVGVWRDLLRPPGLRRTGLLPLDVVVSTVCAGDAHRHLWEEPTFTAEASLGLGGASVRLSVEGVLGLTGALGPGVPGRAAGTVLYSGSGGTTLRSCLHADGRVTAHPAPRARLAAGPGDHPMARHLRDLGLHGARPLLCWTGAGQRLRRDAAVPLPHS